jgi:hypothetical protein
VSNGSLSFIFLENAVTKKLFCIGIWRIFALPCTDILPESSCFILGNLPLPFVDYTGDLL